MLNHQILIACRDSSEAEMLRAALEQPSTPVFHKSSALFDAFSATPDAFILMTSLVMDETAIGLLTKAAIINPTYNIIYARHADQALNVLRLFGCGCAAILGPDEINLLPDLLNPSEDYLDELVMPPFFIDDDESTLKEPPSSTALPLHVSFLGAQAMMSCANALLNINASHAMSMSCVAPSNKWALDHLISSMQEYTLWTAQTRPVVVHGSVTLCQDFKMLAALEPTSQHIVVCHGNLSHDEDLYLSRLPEGTRIFTATDEGYIEQEKNGVGAAIRPEKLWELFITTLYGN